MFNLTDFLGSPIDDPRNSLRANPKTLFQTNACYDPRIAIPVDGVIIHRHGCPDDDLLKTLQSWQEKGFNTERMFFADSDAGWIYTKGGFDGQNHEDDIELTQSGEQVLCAGVRPYMVPTDGWINFLKTQVKNAIDGGASAIYPEEPLAHNFSGYEASFKSLFEKEYNSEWIAPDSSPDAFSKTCRLKNALYLKLEQELEEFTKEYSSEHSRTVRFLIPIHSIYSNLSSRLVAPLGTSLQIDGVDGYIGQIWTGPVRWTLANFSDKNTTFFDSAYLLYDYFVNLTLGSSKTLYLLGDPVEDDPSHQWEEYQIWYKECLVAKLLFPSVDTFEVMPWPDRIFLPGHSTGGGTPGPSEYRTILMSVLTTLQDIPKATDSDLNYSGPRIGMLVGDTAMWQNNHHPVQDPFLGPLVPVLRKGIPIASVPVERLNDPGFISRFDLLMLSYEAWKPAFPEYHQQLANWVRQGGVLLLFNTSDEFDAIDMFWKSEGFPDPESHLLARFEMGSQVLQENNGIDNSLVCQKQWGKGHVLVSNLTPSDIASKADVMNEYVQMLTHCLAEYFSASLDGPGCFALRRGPFLVVHTFDKANVCQGVFIDIYHQDLPLLVDPEIPEQTSAILFDITSLLQGHCPRVLYSTYRLFGKKESPNETTFFIQGPQETEGRVRLFCAQKKVDELTVLNKNGTSQTVEVSKGERDTLLIRFPYDSDGLAFKITWQ